MRTQAKKRRGRTSSGHSPKERLEELLRQAALLRGKGDLGRAEEIYRQAVHVCPQGDQAWAELGCFLADSERFSEARDCFRRALATTRPAAATRAAATGTEDAPREAIRLLEGIVAVHPSWIRGVFSLGCAYKAIGEFGPARTHLGKALALDSALEAPIRSQFASMKWRENEPLEAIAEADRALQVDPASRQAHGVRAVCCNMLWRIDEAIASFRRAIEIAPDPQLHRSLLFAMNFLPETTPEAHYAEACRWNSLYAAPLACHIRPHGNIPDPDRRLRLGYVSPDLYNHAIMRFLPPIFEHHDHSRFEVSVYSVGATVDDLTEGLRRSVDHYVAFQGSGEELAELVRADRIDILVDLAGHTMDWAFYQAFAMKPAPVQVSWLGVMSTTGLSTMDYFLGDELLPCPGTEHLFSETV
jgi:protein O-GlcNAc transferase